MGAYCGTTQLWPMDSIPVGFLPCDGSEVSQVTYADLYAILGGIFGSAAPGMFKLPDARGYFPRCYGATTIDPDAATRIDRGDGTGGNVIGSKQDDAFVQHTHNVSVGGPGVGGIINWVVSTNVTGVTSLAFGGSDTRPKNIYLQMIIKF